MTVVKANCIGGLGPLFLDLGANGSGKTTTIRLGLFALLRYKQTLD